MMTSGVFGAHHVRDPRPKPTSIRMYERELGLGTPTQRRANSRLIVQVTSTLSAVVRFSIVSDLELGNASNH